MAQEKRKRGLKIDRIRRSQILNHPLAGAFSLRRETASRTTGRRPDSKYSTWAKGLSTDSKDSDPHVEPLTDSATWSNDAAGSGVSLGDPARCLLPLLAINQFAYDSATASLFYTELRDLGAVNYAIKTISAKNPYTMTKSVLRVKLRVASIKLSPARVMMVRTSSPQVYFKGPRWEYQARSFRENLTKSPTTCSKHVACNLRWVYIKKLC